MEKNSGQIILFIIGFLFTLYGLFDAFYLNNPHFYTYYSIGLAILSIQLYTYLFGFPFKNWNYKQSGVYISFLLLFPIITDYLGMSFGFWDYPSYITLMDWIIQKIFEFSVSLLYIQFLFMIGYKLLLKKFEYYTAFLFSLFFPIIIGILTEFPNVFADSWVILNLPFSNFQIGPFYVVWITFGYFILCLFPHYVYEICNNRFKKIIF